MRSVRSASNVRRVRGTGAAKAASATISLAMENLTRRSFLLTASAATLAAAAAPGFAAPRRQRVYVGSGTSQGILAYSWNPATGELFAEGIAAPLPNATWITFSAGHEFLFAASEADSFNGKPTGEVSSFKV